MNTHTIKPIPVNNGYMRPEDAIKLIDHLPSICDPTPNFEEKEIDEGMIPLSLEEKIKLTIKPALDNEQKTIVSIQDVGIKIYNDGRRVLASASDYYQAFKQIKYRNDKIHNQLLHTELQKDFSESHIITSTRIIYNTENLNARIIHHYASEIINPTEKQVFIPNFNNGNPLREVLDNEQGLNYLQKLFNTSDSAKEITKILEYVSNTNPEKIRIWSPSLSERANCSYKVVKFSYHDVGGFHIDSNINTGCFRGVKYLK